VLSTVLINQPCRKIIPAGNSASLEAPAITSGDNFSIADLKLTSSSLHTNLA